MAKKKNHKTKRQSTRKSKAAKNSGEDIFSYIKSLGIALLMALLLKHFVIEAYRIPTGSMEDTILVGDFLIANKFIYGVTIPFTDIRLPAVRDPKPGDIVIFKFPLDPSFNYVKRCVAGPGQTVEVKNKIVYVNGVKFDDEAFVKHIDTVIAQPGSREYKRDNFGPVKVPPDHFFMMGDNRDNSYDSRYWGPVKKDFILGEAMFIHWSWAPDYNSPKVSVSDPLSVPRLFLYNLVHFPQRVRWHRLLTIVR